jgi:hypothetical protein
MMLLAEAALRSFLLTSAVWLTLKLFRVRNPHTEMAVWSGILMVSLAMPLLMRWVPAETLPFQLYQGWIAAPGEATPTATPVASATAFPLAFLLYAAYLAPAVILTARLAFGLLQGLRLLRRSRPIHAAWTEGRDIRLSPDLAMPAAIARTILLPADFSDWDVAQRRAVLAHEASHIERGDFYLLLIAALYRALFWFNPAAWWLDRRLADLAETCSDAAALAVSEDRLSYARLLIDLAGTARSSPAGLAMANYATVKRRVERILAESGIPARLGWRKLALIAAALIPAALAAAGTTAMSDRQILAERIAAGRPQPGSEAMLRSHIQQVQRGEIDDNSLGVEGMADGIRALLPQIRPPMVELGPITAVQFQGIDPEGMDLYLVTHAHGTRHWAIHLNPDGRIQSMWFSPTT